MSSVQRCTHKNYNYFHYLIQLYNYGLTIFENPIVYLLIEPKEHPASNYVLKGLYKYFSLGYTKLTLCLFLLDTRPFTLKLKSSLIGNYICKYQQRQRGLPQLEHSIESQWCTSSFDDRARICIQNSRNHHRHSFLSQFGP